MNAHQHFFSAVALALPAAAQLSVTNLPTPTSSPRSIVLVPTPVSLHAICSMTQSSRQVPVDVTLPAAPVVGTDTTFTRDQFTDAVYSSAFGGRLVSGHRFGGIQVWDATLPNLPGPLPQLGFQTTNYSHEGLKTVIWQNQTYVVYGEQHTSPTSMGGLELYRLDAAGVTFIGEHMMTAAAGRALTTSRDGRMVWQWGDQNNDANDGVLRTYSTNGFTGAPILINTINHPFTTVYYDKDIELNANGNNLLSAMGWDGMRAIDVSIPTSPVINTVLGPSTTIFIDGVTFAPGTNLSVVWGLVRVGTTDFDFLAFFDGSVPGFAIPLAIFLVNFRVDDCKVLGNHLYCVGRDRASSLAPILVIY